MRRTLALTPLLLLLGCEKPADTAAPSATSVAAPPAAVTTAPASPYGGDFKGVGTEPFWGFEIRGGKLKFSRMDATDVTAVDPVITVADNIATWSWPGVTISLTEGACSDGMSDKSYPYKAVVRLKNETLSGCAERPKP